MIPVRPAQCQEVWEAVGLRLMRDHSDPATVTTYLTAVHDHQTNKIGA